jgi:hypothetical protein
VWWGETHLLAGQPADAMDRAVRALDLARVQKEPAYEAYALHLLGEIAARRDPSDADTAEHRYREALTLAGRLGMRPLVARCHLGLGVLARAAGRRAAAAEELSEAARMLREMEMPFWLARAKAEAARL